MLLSRDLILSANDLKKELVSVPEWGGDIYISLMTGESRDAWEQSLVTENGANLANIRARLIAFTAVGEDGQRLFSNSDADLLGKKSSTALERCSKVAQKLNKLTSDDLESLSKN